MTTISDREFADISSRSVERLRDCIEVLEEFSVSTEDDFLYIGAKLKGFHDRAARISDLSSSTVSLMSDSEPGGDTDDAVEWLNQLIELKGGLNGTGSLDLREQLSSRVILLIPEYSETILKNINAIVTSLQLHDITRQQFEKSRSAFHAVVKSLEEGANSGGDTGDAAADRQQDMLASLFRFSVAEAALIRSTCDDFLSAVNAVINSLTSLSADVLTIVGEVSRISGEVKPGCSARVNDEIKTRLADIEGIGQALSAEITDVVRTIRIHTSVDLLVERLLSNLQEIIADVRNAVADLPEPAEMGLDLAPTRPAEIEKKTGEFGDNVDLF